MSVRGQAGLGELDTVCPQSKERDYRKTFDIFHMETLSALALRAWSPVITSHTGREENLI